MSNTLTVAGALRALRAQWVYLRQPAEWLEHLSYDEAAMNTHAEAIRLGAIRVAVPMPCMGCDNGALGYYAIDDPRREEPDMDFQWRMCKDYEPDFLW